MYLMERNSLFLLVLVRKQLFISLIYIEHYEIGSLFFLIIIAAAGLRGKIRKLTHDIVIRLQHLIRCPHPSKFFISDSDISMSKYPQIFH